VGIIIVVNTVLMMLETQYKGNETGYMVGARGMDISAQESWPHAGEVFEYSERIFTIIYTMELIIRLAVFQTDFFRQVINYLDSFVVLVSLLAWVFGSQTHVNPSMIRFLRLAKLARGLRLLRLGKALDSLHLLLQCLISSLTTLFWTCLLLTIIQSLAAMFLSQATRSFIDDSRNPKTARVAVFEFYGTFTRSLLTLLEIMLANWSPPCRVLVENISEWYTIFFLIYRCIGGFAVLNIVNAVFIQTTLKVAQSQKDFMILQKERAQEDFAYKLKNLFYELDISGDGFVTIEEFKAMLSQPEIKTWMSALEIDPQDLEGLFLLIDDGNGQISLSEFIMGVTRIKGTAKSVDMAHTLTNLKRLDTKLNSLLVQSNTLSI